MVIIKNNVITITRGDTLETPVAIELESGKDFYPSNGDRIRFALKKRYSDPKPIIIKNIDGENLILRLDAEETKILSPGRYVYDIELTTAEGYVDTFIDRGEFYVTEEVY